MYSLHPSAPLSRWTPSSHPWGKLFNSTYFHTLEQKDAHHYLLVAVKIQDKNLVEFVYGLDNDLVYICLFFTHTVSEYTNMIHDDSRFLENCACFLHCSVVRKK